jgi:hypothetical protein
MSWNTYVNDGSLSKIPPRIARNGMGKGKPLTTSGSLHCFVVPCREARILADEIEPLEFLVKGQVDGRLIGLLTALPLDHGVYYHGYRGIHVPTYESHPGIGQLILKKKARGAVVGDETLPGLMEDVVGDCVSDHSSQVQLEHIDARQLLRFLCHLIVGYVSCEWNSFGHFEYPYSFERQLIDGLAMCQNCCG